MLLKFTACPRAFIGPPVALGSLSDSDLRERHMNESLYIAASGMAAVQRMLDNAAHNTVNAQTPGYQKHQMVLKNFGAHLDAAGARADLISSDEVIAFEEGQMRPSENPMAMALRGQGFFVVRPEQASGDVLFTRNGDFTLNNEGELTTRAGYPVLSSDEETVKIDPVAGPIHVSEKGEVIQGGEVLAQLQVVDFPPEERNILAPAGETLFRSPTGFRPALTEGATTVHQGMLEFPRNAGVKGLINMLIANKNYEAMQKAIRSVDSVNENMLKNTQ